MSKPAGRNNSKITGRPQGGGNKLQGLESSATHYYVAKNTGQSYRTETGDGRNRNLVIYLNQLGGVGRHRSQFRPNADGIKKSIIYNIYFYSYTYKIISLISDPTKYNLVYFNNKKTKIENDLNNLLGDRYNVINFRSGSIYAEVYTYSELNTDSFRNILQKNEGDLSIEEIDKKKILLFSLENYLPYRGNAILFNNPIEVNNVEYTEFTEIIDGDTVTTNNNICISIINFINKSDLNNVNIRIICIDAPELNQFNERPPEPYAEEAKDLLTTLLTNPLKTYKIIITGIDAPRGAAGRRRILAHIKFSSDNGYKYVATELLKNGYASLISINTDCLLNADFINANEYAKNNKLGKYS